MWTYLEIDGDGEYTSISPALPGPQTAYLAFDVVRDTVVIGYTERGGYSSFLGPNVDDDCTIVAFAPLGETTLPDMDMVHRLTPFKNAYLNLDGMPVRLFGAEFTA